MAIAPGETVGPYRIIDRVGQGGMAAVFRAYHTTLDRYVAIKVMNPAISNDPQFLSRFQREARIVAKLDHPNIIPIYDFAIHEGTPYLVMRLIEGKTLKAILRNSPLPPSEILSFIRPVIAALEYAHSHGVLHRDIKPSNIMIADDGQVYLADFGLARIEQTAISTFSQDSLVGTPQYISPEQAKGEPTDARTDVYQLGIILFEMLTGHVPFTSDTPYSIIHDQIYSPPPLPSSINQDISPAVQVVLLKALAKEPNERYFSVTDLLAALEGALGVEPSTRITTSPPLNFWRTLHPAVWVGTGALLVIGLILIFGRVFSAPIAMTTLVPNATASYPSIAIGTAVSTTTPQIIPSPTSAPILAPTNIPTLAPTPTQLAPTLAITVTPTPSVPPGMVLVPAGIFWMGASPQDGQAAANEKPGHYVEQSAFVIDQSEISNADYKQCVTAGICEAPRAVYSPQAPNLAYGNSALDNLPVVFVTHGMAAQYCAWLGKRLPYEAEWEKAARGIADPRIYPWGNNWEGERANGAQGNPGLLPVNTYNPKGCSPFSACNMVGNAAEWIFDYYSPSFYADSIRDLVAPSIIRNPVNQGSGGGNFVIRGGSFKSNSFDLRLTKRYVRGGEEAVDDVGFRCAQSLPGQ